MVCLPLLQDGLIRYPDIVKIFDRCFGTKEADEFILEDLRAQQAPTPRDEGPKRGAGRVPSPCAEGRG